MSDFKNRNGEGVAKIEKCLHNLFSYKSFSYFEKKKKKKNTMNFTVDGVSLGAARWEYVENIDKSVIYIAAPGRVT